MDINNIIIALLVSMYAYIISEVFYCFCFCENPYKCTATKNHVKKKIAACSYLKDSLGDKNQAR